MAPLVALLAHLPKIRQTCLTLVLIAGVFDFVASIVLLAYQLALTVRPPSLTKTSQPD